MAKRLTSTFPALPLSGKCFVVTGVANENSIGAGCAEALAAQGARIAIVCRNQKTIEKYAKPVVEATNPDFVVACDLNDPEDLQTLVARCKQEWGHVDGFVHSVNGGASREAVRGNLIDCPKEDFSGLMAGSVYSFIGMAKAFLPLMRPGSTMITMSYDGSHHVSPGYNVIAPVKAALEASVRSLSDELGPHGIRVLTVSPGPLATRASKALSEVNTLLEDGARNAPLGRLVTVDEVGNMVAFLMSPLASAMTGHVIPVDAGLSIEGPFHHPHLPPRPSEPAGP